MFPTNVARRCTILTCYIDDPWNQCVTWVKERLSISRQNNETVVYPEDESTHD